MPTDIITNEAFEKWAKRNDWLMIGEASSTTGRNRSYLTPSGKVVIAMYDLSGKLQMFGEPVITPQSPLDMLTRKKQ